MSEDQLSKMYGRNYYMRRGDPLISIDAPADVLQVVAILPGGEIKQLVYDAVSKRWEARFDVPTYAGEGDYTIEVVIVDKAGKRRSMKLTYQVDMSAPRGQGIAKRADDSDKWRLEVRGDGDTTRVSALLPWGERVELHASTTDKTRFFGFADARTAAAAGGDTASVVTYILTDRAHNRTEITVDLAQ